MMANVKIAPKLRKKYFYTSNDGRMNGEKIYIEKSIKTIPFLIVQNDANILLLLRDNINFTRFNE